MNLATRILLFSGVRVFGPYNGLTGRFDYYVDATNGNDSNDGRSPGKAWKTLSKIAAGITSPGTTARVKVLAGSYEAADDYVIVQDGASKSVLHIVFEPGCTVDGTAANVAVPTRNGFEFNGYTGATAYIYGNGLVLRNYSEATASSPNGIGNRGDHVCYVYDVYVTNCDDGFSSHQDARMYVYDCTAADCEKAAFAHVDSSQTFHYRCTFTARAAASLGIGSINDATTVGYFEDCALIPATSAQTVNLKNTTLKRCQIGTDTLRVDLASGTTPAVQCTITDSYLNMFIDGNLGAVLRRCFGKMTIRIRNGGSQNVQHCTFTDPTTGKPSIIVSDTDFASAQTLVFNNNAIKTSTAVKFMFMDATNAGYVVAAGAQFFNNALNGSAAYYSTLVTADAGGTVIVGTLSTDIGITGTPATYVMTDYAYPSASSAAVGAGTSGTNIGIGSAEVDVRRSRVPALS